MDTIALLDKFLIANNEYETNLLCEILDCLQKDISKIYLKERSGYGYSQNKILEKSETIKEIIKDYVHGFDDTNAGEILLFLSNLPSIAEDISSDIENQTEGMSGLVQISARDKVDLYMKQVFNEGYKTLYEDVDDKQIGVNLYYQCEKFIDALVLEFKQNILPMIDKENLCYDDIIYFRRFLINLANNNENFSFIECEKCDRDDCTSYTVCSTLPRVNHHEHLLIEYKRRIDLLNKKLENGKITEEEYRLLGSENHDETIKKLVLLNPRDNGKEHRKIQFIGEPKIFSIISAERFEKILKRRYTGEAYEKDKDIYYMLSVGIDPYELFNGDKLIPKLKYVHSAYCVDESAK